MLLRGNITKQRENILVRLLIAEREVGADRSESASMETTPVTVSPAELRFQVVLNSATVQKIQVHAVGPSATFKIKTTNPKRYSVRPNVGIAWSERPADVTVQLCAFKEAPPDQAKCKDKFQVLSIVLTPEQSEQLQALSQEERHAMLNELWAADEVKGASVTKVKCSFIVPSSQPHPIPEESEAVQFSPSRAPTPAVEGVEGVPVEDEGDTAAAPSESPGEAEAEPKETESGTPTQSTASAASEPTTEKAMVTRLQQQAEEQAEELAVAVQENEKLKQENESLKAKLRERKKQSEKAMLEAEDQIDGLKQELNEQRLKQPPPPLPAEGKGAGSGGGYSTMLVFFVALLGLLLGMLGQLRFGEAVAAPAIAGDAPPELSATEPPERVVS